MTRFFTALVLVGLMACSAHAVSVLDWDFESDSPQTAGTTTFTGTDGSPGGNHGPVYTIGVTSGPATGSVATNGSLQPAWSALSPVGSNVVIGNDGGNAPAGNSTNYFSMYGGDYLAIDNAFNGDLDNLGIGGNDFTISFDFMTAGIGHNVMRFDATNGNFIRVWAQPSNELQILFEGPDTGQGGKEVQHWWRPTAGIPLNTWLSVELGIAGGDSFAKVNGSTTDIDIEGTPIRDWVLDDLTTAQFNHTTFAPDHQWSGQMSIDDVLIDVVPEPSALLLIVMGSLALCWRRR